MSAMAKITPLVTTVTKPATNLRDADATPMINIQEFCEEYYEDIFPIIMDKVCRDRRKDVHTRLDFGKGPRERTREESHHSSARAQTTKLERLKVQDCLRYGDHYVLDRLGGSTCGTVGDAYMVSYVRLNPNKGGQGKGSNRFTPLTRTPKWILVAEAGKFQSPPPMVTPVEKRSSNKFCDFHNDKGHNTDECMQLKKQIEELVRVGKLSHLIKEIKHGRDQSMPGKKDTPAKDNGIIRRPGIREIQAVPSTAHGMLKFLVEGRIVTIHSIILIPTECTLVITSSSISKEERTRPDNFKVALHPDFPDQELNTGSTSGRDIHQSSKKRGQAPERAKQIQVEVQKLVEAGIMREVYYHDWLSNSVMVAESDEEKTTFHTRQGMYCYTKMPFGLKNTGATYQRLMDKAFDSQIGRNIQVYIDELVVKSYTEAEMLRDIDEMFRTLRKINMKLNPKKCTFGVAEGVFLGYVVTPDGIKLCPDKTAAVLQLPSSQTIKETVEAEQAFKQLKQHLSKLPLLVAPKPMEELIIYLSATYGDISAVLMTERGATHTSIYFIIPALQGLKLNYTPMEKLVLSPVFAAKRLRRYFQAHPITVVTDQPIKKIMSRPDVILANFLIKMPDENPQAAPVVETQQEPWTLFTNGSSRVDGLTSNNEFEYEALIAGLRIAAQMGVQNVHVSVDSKLIANQVLGTQSFLMPWSRCVGPLQAEYVIREILERSCSMHVDHGKVKFLIVTMDYFTKWIEAKSSGDNHWRSAVIPAKIGMPMYRTVAVDVVSNDEELWLNLNLLEERRERAAICEAKAK
nr:reverse transcriptase domain-containing protein [Tanacetum cinerariifolium]